MTTRTYSSVLDQTTDAAFRAWGSELATNIAAIGVVQTADTGQINWTTVTRAAGNTAAGYEIWRLSDSSLYFKLEYGSGGTNSTPQLWITVGTGSNGSGTLTGQTCTRSTCFVNNAPASTSTPYITYMCATADAFALVYKVNAYTGSIPMGFFVVGKSVGSNGAANSTGYGILTLNGFELALQSVRTAATAVTYSKQNSMYAAIPGLPASSLDGADVQAYLLWLNLPRALPFAWAAIFMRGEVTAYNTVTCALVGSTNRTYLALGQITFGFFYSSLLGSSTYSFLMIWE